MARTVLITGCSDGGLGAALAVAFHNHGDRVFATARNVSKMASLQSIGIETLAMDVQSEESIKACALQVSALTGGSLDVLVNNAGSVCYMPVLDVSIADMSQQFDTNVLSIVRTTQQFFPLLRNAKQPRGGQLVNNTSVIGEFAMPWQAPYTTSKAAASMVTATLRRELKPFGIRVTDLKTGSVGSNIFQNWASNAATGTGTGTDPSASTSTPDTKPKPTDPPVLPESSVYTAAKSKIETFMRGDFGITPQPAHVWAQQVVKDLSKSNVPAEVWRGGNVNALWFLTTFFPSFVVENAVAKMNGLDLVERQVKEMSNKS